MKLNVLIADDDLRMRQLVADILKEEDARIVLAEDGAIAIEQIRNEPFDIVFTDMRMPKADGIKVLEYTHEYAPDTLVIVITGYGTVESAIEAMKMGAYDYIQKPFEPDELLMLFNRARQHLHLINENKRLRQEVEEIKGDEIVGVSRIIKELKDILLRVATFDTTVLIQGETGCGKELVAKFLHKNSSRRDGVFLPINCAAITETLLESELFGYEKGAFTGANKQKKGLFELADKGTVFLDEINAISLNFQAKLLRVLQEGSFIRVGGTGQTRVDVRIIAASNTPLQKEVESGTFRKDLFYRLNVVALEIPPLRRRKEDIPILSYHFLNRYCARYGKHIKGISSKVMDKLCSYHWPGNVRELENTIERSVIMETSDELRSIHLPKNEGITPEIDRLDDIVPIATMERLLIEKALRALNGQRAKVAEALGISPTSLWRKIKRYGLK